MFSNLCVGKFGKSFLSTPNNYKIPLQIRNLSGLTPRRSPIVPLKRFIRHGEHDHHHYSYLDPEKQKYENKMAERVTWLGLASNVIMAAGKGTAGVVGSSSALVADAAHSLSDLISDVVTLWTLKISRREKDATHPYGYGRYEAVGAVGVGGLLILAGVGIGQHSLEHLMSPVYPTQLALWASMASVVFKESIYQITRRVGERQESQVLIANAWHHRSDAISSILAFVGILGAQVGFPFLDPIAGLAVAALIIRMGLKTCTKSLKDLTDAMDSPQISKEIERVMMETEGVKKYFNLRIRSMGRFVSADVSIVVDPFSSVSTGFQVAERVRQRIQRALPRVTEVLVHVSPSAEPPRTLLMRPPRVIEEDIRTSLKAIPEVEGTTDVLLHYVNQRLTAQVTIAVDSSVGSVEELKRIGQKSKERIETEVLDVDEAQLRVEVLEETKEKSLKGIPGRKHSTTQ